MSLMRVMDFTSQIFQHPQMDKVNATSLPVIIFDDRAFIIEKVRVRKGRLEIVAGRKLTAGE